MVGIYTPPKFGKNVDDLIGRGSLAIVERDKERIDAEPKTILISVTVKGDVQDVINELRQSFNVITAKEIAAVVPASRLDDLRDYYETMQNDFSGAVSEKVSEIVEDMPSVTEIWNQSDMARHFKVSPSTIARWRSKKPFGVRAANGRGWRMTKKEVMNYVPPNMGKRGRKKKSVK